MGSLFTPWVSWASLWAKHVSVKRKCCKKESEVERGGSVNRDKGGWLEFSSCFSFFRTLGPGFILCMAKRLDYSWLPLKSPSLHVKSRFSFMGALSILLTHFHSWTHWDTGRQCPVWPQCCYSFSQISFLAMPFLNNRYLWETNTHRVCEVWVPYHKISSSVTT